MERASLAMQASDLFVVLEKAFRRRSRRCSRCQFSLPFRTDPQGADERWSVTPTETCSYDCRLILEELIAEYQRRYHLSERGPFPAH